MKTTITLIVVAVLILVVVAALTVGTVYRRRQSVRLKRQFGPEYDRTVAQLGGQSRAEAELCKRAERIAKLNIKPLTAQQAATFSEAWKRIQGLFVDNPRGAVTAADKLVQEVMAARGYPMGDFDRRASDISVDHPVVVEEYRAAQVIAAKDARGEADTEALRTAFVHYRSLFSELLEIRPSAIPEKPRPRLAVHS